MSRMRLTQQEADPIGGLTAAPIVPIGAVIAFAASVVLTIAHWDEVGAPIAAALGIAFVAAAGVTASLSASPQFAPFTADRLWVIVALAVGGAIAEYISTIGANRYLYDDYGPAVVGLLILSVAPFCTWISLVLAGVLAAAVLSILVVGSAAATMTTVPLVSLFAVSSAAVLSLSAAAAGYSYAIVDETLAWQRDANRAALRRDAELREGIARSVQQSRISVLGREVLPFLAGVMTADRITVADADRARELAEALRRALKEGIESTWLDDLAATVRASRSIPVVVVDPDAAARDLDDDQRSALTALISWLGDGRRSSAIRIALAADTHGRRISVVADAGAEPPARRDLDRFAAVARAVSMRAEVDITGENVSVELSHVLE